MNSYHAYIDQIVDLRKVGLNLNFDANIENDDLKNNKSL